MKKELNQNKRKEIEKVFDQLKQEDAKYDLQSSNLNKLENQIISLYKKWQSIFDIWPLRFDSIQFNHPTILYLYLRYF